MFKILHFSDSHLGLRQYSMPGRLVDFASSLDEVLEVAIANEVDLVVDTGDTFDSPDPGPYSVRAFRRFVAALDRHQIAFLGINGNHNSHSESALFREGNWMDAVSDTVIRPRDPSKPITVRSLRDPSKAITVVCSDWMPRDKIPAFLSEIPVVVDAIFLHQSCDGFMPTIGRPEMTPSMIDGKARYAGIGDIHVTKKIEGELGTIIGSAGSTEMTKANEPVEKFVILVSIDESNPSARVVWDPVRINTRGIINFPCITLEHQIETLRSRISQALEYCGPKKPMVVCSFVRSLAPRMAEFQKTLSEMGIEMTRFSPEPDVVASEIIVQERAERSTSMGEVLAEIIPDPTAMNLALALWHNPLAAEATIESFKQTILSKHLNENHASQA